MRWLDPASQARLKGLALSPRRASGLSGAPGKHRTLARGHSRDFAQHRPYSYGDESRSIDWKAYARLDRFYVREFRAEDRIPVFILLDRSGSMGYAGAGRPSKLDLGRHVAAAIAWLALSQGDEAGLVTFSAQAQLALPPRAGAAQLGTFDDALTAAAASGETDLARAIENAAEALPRRGMVVLISDLMGDTAGALKAVRALTARRHEVLVVRTIDPDERDFPYEGPCLMEGLEGGEPLFVDAREAAPAYRAAFARQADVYAGSLRRAGLPYAVVETGGHWEAALGRLLSR
ncbi:MAG: hypothetical protein COV48_00375 [Elusimicrobia bacterium CG11_big_fil_rev_8_21_14_0_20_64_6]|nr:MAG: hypothetical protein COV48_00375 [Elusimicrobia bacterium CG11_big_fil_rev_8_21_14_0_20_64_6]